MQACERRHALLALMTGRSPAGRSEHFPDLLSERATLPPTVFTVVQRSVSRVICPLIRATRCDYLITVMLVVAGQFLQCLAVLGRDSQTCGRAHLLLSAKARRLLGHLPGRIVIRGPILSRWFSRKL